MAVLKIPQSEIRVREQRVPQLGALSIPLSIATQEGAAFASLGKVVEDIQKEQRAVEDQNQFLDIIGKANVDLQKASASAANNTDLDFALNQFKEATKPDRFLSYTEGSNKRVKKLFGEWLSKNVIKEQGSIIGSVTKKHQAKALETVNTRADELSILSASSNFTEASTASNELDSFLNKPETRAVLGINYDSFVKEKQNQKKRFRIEFGSINHPDYTLKNIDKIEREIGVEGAMDIRETALNKIRSNEDFKIKQEEFVKRADEDNKIGTFTEVLLRIQADDDPEYLGKIPTLDLIADLFYEDKINSAQYDALIRFYKNPKARGDDEVFDIINHQLFIANDVNEVDELERTMQLTPEFLLKVGIKDMATMKAVIEKNKDRTVFLSDKYFTEVLNTVMGKIDSTIIKEYGDKDTTDQLVRINGLRVYKEFIAEGNSPAEAFQKTVGGYLFQQNKLPTIYSIADLRTINFPEPSDTERKKGSKGIFNEKRQEVMDLYKAGSISIDDFKNDLNSLKLMEDIHDVRQRAVGAGMLDSAVDKEKFPFAKSNIAAFTNGGTTPNTDR